MKRDLLFFIAGLSFGIAAGYFTFRSLAPDGSPPPAETSVAAATGSTIGLDSESETAPFDEAQADELRRQAENDPNDATARRLLGKLYLDSGRYQEAAAWLSAAVELTPDDLDARTQLALSYLNAGNLDQTVATYERSLTLDPNHPASLLGLGRVKLYLQQDIDAGLAMWKKLVAVAPSSVEAQSVRDELEALTSAHPGS